MKRLLFLLLISASSAIAQETYSVPATAQQVIDLAAIVSRDNEETCERLLLADNCSQGDACTAAGATGGSGCSAAQARAANARIYPNTQAGREEYVRFGVLAPWFVDRKPLVFARTQKKACRWWNDPSTTQTQKDTECTNKGIASPCVLYPPVCN